MIFFPDRYITHLEAEIQWYRTELARERHRADIAVDELLRLKVGAAPVRPPEPDPLLSRLDEMTSHPEFTQAGGTE